MRSEKVKQARIGVFDSGVGGLTVLRELYRQLPSESILYFADTARLPYGDRSPAEIISFVREILGWMQMQQVKMVVMACNTSSALALEVARDEGQLPILGLIHPGAQAAINHGSRIGVIATPTTAASNAYRRAISGIDSTAKVWQVGCPEFVPLIEGNRVHDAYTREVVEDYLRPLIDRHIDVLVYGCTHYPHLAPVIQSVLPTFVQTIDPATYLVSEVKDILNQMGLRNNRLPLPTRFCVSGSNPQDFGRLSAQWLGYKPLVEQVDLNEGLYQSA